MPIHLPFLTRWLPHPLGALQILLEIPSSFLPAIALGELTGLGMGGSVWFGFGARRLVPQSFHRIVNVYNDGI
ncbi:hypothetical protein BT96DRAFT_914585, partial [Gymnopus androsaceus JB14]